MARLFLLFCKKKSFPILQINADTCCQLTADCGQMAVEAGGKLKVGHLSGHFGYICLPFVVPFVTTDYMTMEITKLLVLEKTNLKKAKNRIK